MKKLHLGKVIDELQVGEKAELTKSITQVDVYLYVGVTGDLNPLYLDADYAAGTRYKGAIVPGILTAGLVNAALTTELPGAGTVTVKQTFEFVKPVRCGDSITTSLEITEIDKAAHRVTIKSESHNQKGELCMTGWLVVIPPEKTFPGLESLWEDYH